MHFHLCGVHPLLADDTEDQELQQRRARKYRHSSTPNVGWTMKNYGNKSGVMEAWAKMVTGNKVTGRQHYRSPRDIHSTGLFPSMQQSLEKATEYV